jgi:hypothetical protein
MTYHRDDLLTTRAAAHYLGCSEQLIRLAIADGRLRPPGVLRIHAPKGFLYGLRVAALRRFVVRPRGRPVGS